MLLAVLRDVDIFELLDSDDKVGSLLLLDLVAWALEDVMGDTVFLVDKVLLGEDFEVDIAFAKMHAQACLTEGLFLFGIGESVLGLPKHVRDVFYRTTS